jgi:hypothetical protein
MVLPALRDSCLLCVVGTDKNYNFSAVRSPVELKLGGDLGLVSQISMHVLVSRFDYFYIVNKQKKKNAKIAVVQNLRFSPTFQVRLI